MTDTFVHAKYQKLDKGLSRSLRQTLQALTSVRRELAASCLESEADRNLWRWAIIYTIVLNDVASSARRLLIDGKHSRAAIILRRIAFEYRTRFHYYWTHADECKTAMDEFTRKAELFASRLGPEDIKLILDADYDDAAFRAAPKRYKKFETVCDDVRGKSGPDFYARFYSYPSALLHGDATASMDVLEIIEGDKWRVHLDSRRPFTNEIAGNLTVFLLDFTIDVSTAFQLSTLADLKAVGAEFNSVRGRLGIEIET